MVTKKELKSVEFDGKQLETIADLVETTIETWTDTYEEVELTGEMWEQFENFNEVMDMLIVLGDYEESKTTTYQLGRNIYHKHCDEIYEVDYMKIKK